MTLVTHVTPGVRVCVGDQVFDLDMLNLSCLLVVQRKLLTRQTHIYLEFKGRPRTEVQTRGPSTRIGLCSHGSP